MENLTKIRDKNGRFVKGHKCLKGSEKGWFEKGKSSWNKGVKCPQISAKLKGRSLVHSGSFKKGHKGFNRTGFKWSEDSKRQLSEFKKELYKDKTKHPRWQGGKSFELYGIDFNKPFKESIRNRDNQVCMVCGIHREKLNRNLDVHHINYDKLISIPQNCISLCKSCHTKTGVNRKHWTQFFQSLLSERYDYKYNKGEIILEIWKN